MNRTLSRPLPACPAHDVADDPVAPRDCSLPGRCRLPGGRRRCRGSATPKLAFLLLLVSASGYGMWKYGVLQFPGTTPVAPVAAAVVTPPAPVPAPAAPKPALTQCVDASGKLLWTDTICPAGSTSTTLQPGTGSTYSSEDSMRPTRDMPVYVAPPPVVVVPPQTDESDTYVVGHNGNAARLWRLRHDEELRELAHDQPRQGDGGNSRPVHVATGTPRRPLQP